METKTFATYYRIVSDSSDVSLGKRFRDYYMTGELQSEGRYISIDKYDDSKSVMDGEWVTYYRSGNIEEKGFRRNGVEEGEYTAYYDNGLVKLRCMMVNGKANGILTEFDEKGQTCSQTEMLDGHPRYDYYVKSNQNGFVGKFRISDNTLIWESPSPSEIETEYNNGVEWSYYVKNGLKVSMINSRVKDYGKWYQISIVIANNSFVPVDFDPETITSTLRKANGQEIPLEVYSSERYMKKVKRIQRWNLALASIAEGFAAAGAGYSSSTTYTTTYGNGYASYGTAYTTTYDGAAAYQAQVMAGARLDSYENSLKQARQVRQEGYLRRTTIYPGQAIAGYMNIKRCKGESMDVVVDINGAKYVFLWNLKK